jgi:hypothetical protein
VVVLISGIQVLAFATIELVWLVVAPGLGFSAPVDDIIALLSTNSVIALAPVEDVVAVSSGDMVFSAEAACASRWATNGSSTKAACGAGSTSAT